MTWNIDKAHTEVSFAVRHLMVSTVRGQFARFDASVTVHPERPSRSSVNATVDAASLSTGHEERDKHLRSADFLDVERYPAITFASNQVAQVGTDSFWVRGNLSVHGVTREVTFRGRFEGPVADLIGQRVVGFELTVEIDRRDFGLDWDLPLEGGGLIVGNAVTITIDAELREGDLEAPPPTAVARERGLAAP